MLRFPRLAPLLLGASLACGEAPDPAPPAEPDAFDAIVSSGDVAIATTPRPDFGTLMLEVDGDRIVRLESARTTTGTTHRRLRVERTRPSEGEPALIFRYPESDAGAEFLVGFAVHPSGEITLALEHPMQSSGAYELLRFAADGALLVRQALPAGTTIPDADLGDLPRPTFRMRSPYTGSALAEGWIRLVPDGEDVIVAFQTEVTAPDGEFQPDVVSAVAWLAWQDGSFVETRMRIVDGRHRLGPAAWAYDEFRWRQSAVRPFLARDASTGHVLVGRAWNDLRCERAALLFGEGTQIDCVFGAVPAIETNRLPFAITSFTREGDREDTRIHWPAETNEFVVFDMDARDGRIALAGVRVRAESDGSVVYYGGNLVPYDGYVALLDRASGATILERAIDGSGRGDVLSAIRFVDGGVLAVGAADWDRWNGGMSISRGADPWVVFVGLDGAVTSRVPPVDSPTRHSHLLAVGVDEREPRTIVAGGLSDAPMTHAGDGGNVAAMVFGDLRMTLALP